MVAVGRTVGGARWWLWLVLLGVLAICIHPLLSVAMAALLTPPAAKRLKAAIAEKEQEAIDFQKISEDEPDRLIEALDAATEDYTVVAREIEEGVEVHQDNGTAFME